MSVCGVTQKRPGFGFPLATIVCPVLAVACLHAKRDEGVCVHSPRPAYMYQLPPTYPPRTEYRRYARGGEAAGWPAVRGTRALPGARVPLAGRVFLRASQRPRLLQQPAALARAPSTPSNFSTYEPMRARDEGVEGHARVRRLRRRRDFQARQGLHRLRPSALFPWRLHSHSAPPARIPLPLQLLRHAVRPLDVLDGLYG